MCPHQIKDICIISSDLLYGLSVDATGQQTNSLWTQICANVIYTDFFSVLHTMKSLKFRTLKWNNFILQCSNFQKMMPKLEMV